MGPDKECCAACDGANVVGCSFKGESECRPLKAKPRTVHTYNPATHIVVSRECAGDVLGLLDAWADRLNAVEHKPTWGIVPDFDPSVTELRAALEGK